jgi:hypothetical protein
LGGLIIASCIILLLTRAFADVEEVGDMEKLRTVLLVTIAVLSLVLFAQTQAGVVLVLFVAAFLGAVVSAMW